MPRMLVGSAAGVVMLVSMTACATVRGRGCDTAEAATVLPSLLWSTDSLLARPKPANDTLATALRAQLTQITRRVQQLERCGALDSASDQRAVAWMALRAGVAGAGKCLGAVARRPG